MHGRLLSVMVKHDEQLEDIYTQGCVFPNMKLVIGYEEITNTHSLMFLKQPFMSCRRPHDSPSALQRPQVHVSRPEPPTDHHLDHMARMRQSLLGTEVHATISGDSTSSAFSCRRVTHLVWVLWQPCLGHPASNQAATGAHASEGALQPRTETACCTGLVSLQA